MAAPLRLAARSAAASLTIAVLLVAPGCRGSGKSYSPSNVAACLRAKNFIVSSPDADFVAQANDGYYVHTSSTASTYGLDSSANISFGNADDLRNVYAQFPGGAREDVRGNALIVWDRFETTSGKILLACFP